MKDTVSVSLLSAANVDAGYGHVRVLEGVSVDVRPGRIVVLVGRNGAGKSTLLKILSRITEPTTGRITIDGRDLRDIPKVDLRDRIGLVLQDTFLFADTVLENIRFGRLDATDEECIEAAKLAEEAGLKVVMNRCPKIEYGRLSGELNWAGVNSRMLSSKRPLLGPKGVQHRVLAGKA